MREKHKREISNHENIFTLPGLLKNKDSSITNADELKVSSRFVRRTGVFTDFIIAAGSNVLIIRPDIIKIKIYYILLDVSFTFLYH